LVECLTEDEVVVGSNPAIPTKYNRMDKPIDEPNDKWHMRISREEFRERVDASKAAFHTKRKAYYESIGMTPSQVFKEALRETFDLKDSRREDSTADSSADGLN
jgi:hypothetical protein